jgi:hypothetical protein
MAIVKKLKPKSYVVICDGQVRGKFERPTDEAAKAAAQAMADRLNAENK